jgi:hypothetical protein
MWPIKSAIHLPTNVYHAVMDEPMRRSPELFEPVKKGRVNAVDAACHRAPADGSRVGTRAAGISRE